MSELLAARVVEYLPEGQEEHDPSPPAALYVPAPQPVHVLVEFRIVPTDPDGHVHQVTLVAPVPP